MTAQCSGGAGCKYAITAPAGATVEGWLYSSANGVSLAVLGRFTAINTLGATTHTSAGAPGPDMIRFTVVNGGTAGSVAIQAASVTAGQTTTVFAGSWLLAQRAL
jgi:hypothetical protein